MEGGTQIGFQESGLRDMGRPDCSEDGVHHRHQLLPLSVLLLAVVAKPLGSGTGCALLWRWVWLSEAGASLLSSSTGPSLPPVLSCTVSLHISLAHTLPFAPQASIYMEPEWGSGDKSRKRPSSHSPRKGSHCVSICNELGRSEEWPNFLELNPNYRWGGCVWGP